MLLPKKVMESLGLSSPHPLNKEEPACFTGFTLWLLLCSNLSQLNIIGRIICSSGWIAVGRTGFRAKHPHTDVLMSRFFHCKASDRKRSSEDPWFKYGGLKWALKIPGSPQQFSSIPHLPGSQFFQRKSPLAQKVWEVLIHRFFLCNALDRHLLF